MNVLVFGAHPDDPETGCGGTIARYVAAGHRVTIAYLTTGEAGIPGKTHEEAATIRRAEASEAAQLLDAKAVFVGQIDGDTRIEPAAYAAVCEVFEQVTPEVVFTHWPIDSHRDHRVCSALACDAWLCTARDAPLYFYEVLTGEQSMSFTPTDFVDVGEVLEVKHRACLAHRSQPIESEVLPAHIEMERFRGSQSGCSAAEAFVRHVPGPFGRLP